MLLQKEKKKHGRKHKFCSLKSTPQNLNFLVTAHTYLVDTHISVKSLSLCLSQANGLK